MPRTPGDPPDAPPEQVWRSLLPLRPSRRLVCRLRGAETVPLSVHAVPFAVEALARDAAHSGLEEEEILRDRAAALEVLAVVLHTPRGRAFGCAANLGELEDHELASLARETFAVLDIIAPTAARSNLTTWRAVLRHGAAHPSNLPEASVLACCMDVAHGVPVPRPDRYWGVSFASLLEGHWMAWQAARDAMKDRK